MNLSRPKSWIAPYMGVALTWGCSFIFIKLSLGFLSPFGVAFIRCALGALTLLVLAMVMRESLPRDRIVWFHLWIVALCINVIPGVLFALAETRTTSILAGLINAMTPLSALFFIAVVFRDDPVSPRQLLGLGFGFIGVLTVLGVWQGLGRNPWWAVGALLLSVTLYGLVFPYSRRYLMPRKLHPVSLAGAQLSLAAVTLLPTFAFFGTNGHGVSLRALFGIIALGVFGSGFAFMWNFRVIELADSSLASTVTYLTPVVAIIVGVIFLHESMTWFEPVGVLLILLGGAIGNGQLLPRR
ncbi:MAG: DMT family transporter [Acidimicrobiales bacterium]